MVERVYDELDHAEVSMRAHRILRTAGLTSRLAVRVVGEFGLRRLAGCGAATVVEIWRWANDGRDANTNYRALVLSLRTLADQIETSDSFAAPGCQ